MKVLAIMQARTGSTRLPNKVLLPLEGKTVLEHVANRVRASRLVSELVIATTANRGDDAVEEACKKIGAGCFRGSEDDVLDRFYQAAKPRTPEHVLRITADCPLADPSVIDKVIQAHLSSGTDYTSNTLRPTYPDGLDAEAFTFKALERAWKEATLQSEREHVTPYIYKHPELFRLLNVENETDLSGKRWTLDEKEDYEFIKNVYKALYPKNRLFGMREVLAFLEEQPDAGKVNAAIKRDEGYAKSIREDREVKPGEMT